MADEATMQRRRTTNPSEARAGNGMVSPEGQMQQLQQPPPPITFPSSSPKKTGKKDEEDHQHPEDKEREKVVVAKWLSRCKQAKERQKGAFQEMRESMSFAAGMQWPGQRARKDNRYVANWTLREINSKVAQLYAKNPKATYERRPRLDFALYSGELESLVPILQSAGSNPSGLLGLPIEQRAMLADYEHGMQQRKIIDRQGKTLEVLFQYQLDEQDEEEGEFKLQFKQMIRRTITAKVGYIRAAFVRDEDALITSSGPGNTVANRALYVKRIAEKVEEGELKRSDKQIEQLQNLAIGLGGSMKDKETFGTNERIVYDCLPSNSILLDSKCKALKGFIGAKWIAIQYCLFIEDVNAIFEADVKVNKASNNSNKAMSSSESQNPKAQSREKGEETILVFEVLDKETRTHFYICEGHDEYLAEPEYLAPAVRGFWPVYALTFNDIEADVDAGQSIFPPSDVELLRDSQVEFNRCRQELKKHRKGNRPRWVASNGVLSEDDKESIGSSDSEDLIELQNLPQGQKVGDVIQPLPMTPIQPEVYDTSPQLQDAQLTTGNPQEALGDQGGATATGQTITQQNHLTVTASNVDDVDDCLTWLARVTAEMAIQGFSPTTVQRLVGPGAVWPQLPEDKANLLAAITLVTKAASSGRPNQVQNINNWKSAAPILQAAGANPQAMVRKTLEVLDSNIDAEEFFPLMNTQPGQQSPSGGEHQPSDQQAHRPGESAPPKQSRPGPGQMQHPPHQESASQMSQQ